MADVDVRERSAKTRRKKPDDVGAVKESPAPSTEAAQSRRPLRIVMSSPKGGSGKTGTCRNLAVAAALDGFKVATVDFDPQTGLTNWWQKRPDEAANIDHYAADIANVDDILVDILDYDIVFFDTATSVEEHLVEMKKLLEPADLVLVPTQETDDDLDSVVPWMGVLLRVQPGPAADENLPGRAQPGPRHRPPADPLGDPRLHRLQGGRTDGHRRPRTA
jgi:hypothetical protein